MHLHAQETGKKQEFAEDILMQHMPKTFILSETC